MKKGFSSLIATIILLGATIILAAIFFTWTSDLFKEDNSKSSCKLEIEKLCAQSSIEISQASVNNTGAIFIIIENTGNYALKAARVTSYLTNQPIYSTVVNFSQPLPPFYPINFTINYYNLIPYNSIEISPIISFNFEEEYCETLCSYKATREF